MNSYEITFFIGILPKESSPIETGEIFLFAVFFLDIYRLREGSELWETHAPTLRRPWRRSGRSQLAICNPNICWLRWNRCRFFFSKNGKINAGQCWRWTLRRQLIDNSSVGAPRVVGAAPACRVADQYHVRRTRSTLHKEKRPRPCLVLWKFYKIFYISRHIESLDAYIEY
jgi:hypothetical protein